jgi:hypothetical protein
MLTGMNIMKMLGSMIVPGASVAVQYAIGGAMHLMIGLFYGVVYAWLVGRVSEWNRFVKGTVYGLAITAIALATMPVMSAVMGGGAANPCGGANPCGASSAAANPCYVGAKNPCGTAAQNPCAAKATGTAANPCAVKNPCAATNPCAAKKPYATKEAAGAANACSANPCGGGATNPCGGSGGPYSGAVSVLNHLVYALTLAFVYGRGAGR